MHRPHRRGLFVTEPGRRKQMVDRYDVVVAGAGLAGTTAAFALSDESNVLLIDSGEVGDGATGVGAGIASPILARKGNPTYMARNALDALDQLCETVGVVTDRGRPLLRPAFDEAQVAYYQRAAERHPDLASWLTPEVTGERFPTIRAELGALEVRRGNVVNLGDFSRSVALGAKARGCAVVQECELLSWSETESNLVVKLRDHLEGERAVRASRLILALGAGYRQFPSLTKLNLHPIKGQTIRAERPQTLNAVPNITGPGYLANDGADIVLGSTFEHNSFDTNPSDAATAAILRLIHPIVPAVSSTSEFEARAGVRVTVPGTRLPMIGPISSSERVWIYTGLGSKGLLMAPLLSAQLSTFLRDSQQIPEKMRVSFLP
ncbi:MAG: FAD-binding oxidoreductase [Rhodothermales bacterium]|nr:FAD-binding oxidoreductase [Rhodothermales bacterium]